MDCTEQSYNIEFYESKEDETMSSPENPTPKDPTYETPVAPAPQPKPKKTYKGFTFKERLLPSILLALLAPLTVCFIAPFEIYGGNVAEFKFVLADFVGVCLLIALGAAAVLAAALLLSRGKVFDVVFGVIFGLSFMFFLQSNYLSLGQTSLAGDGTGPAASVGEIVLNAAIWIIVTAGCVVAMLLLNRYKDTLRLVVTMALVVMLFMSFVSFITVSLTTDVYVPEKNLTTEDTAATLESTTPPAETSAGETGGEIGGETGTDQPGQTPVIDPDAVRMLTVENLGTLATDHNIIFFLVDRFDQRYYDEALVEAPEIFSELQGFTYFNDYIARYPRTFPAVTHLLTGVETDFSLSREDYFKHAYTTAPVMHALKDAGYDINIYTDNYYGYANAAHMADYATNLSLKISYKIVDRPRLSLDMLRLSLYRSLPTGLQPVVGDISTPTFERYVDYDAEYDVSRTNMKALYDWMTAEPFTLREADKGYSFIHMSGCHLPISYNENFESISGADRDDGVVAMRVTFKLISTYIAEMKRLGVYDNATIIITGDHSNIESDDDDPTFPHMTALLVKPAGVTEGGVKVSSAQVSPDDLLATILAEAGAPFLHEGDRTVFDIPAGETRTRRYLFQRKDGGIYESVTYEITGPGRDFNNWKVVARDPLGKSIYD